MGCGACAEACPTGALRIAGFDPPEKPTPNLRIECLRVPVDHLSCGTWMVPCFAGVTVAAAATALAAGANRLIIVDRGWCDTCPASAGSNVASTTQVRLQRSLDRAAPGQFALAIADEPLVVSHAGPAGRLMPRSRRDLFRALLGLQQTANSLAGVLADRAALNRLSAAAGNARPQLYPQLAVDERCRDHGVCAATCPTRALRWEEADGGQMRRLVFDAERCIACGQCERLCPEQAPTLSPLASAESSPVFLRERHVSACAECDDTFLASDATGTLCPACRKTEHLGWAIHGKDRSEGDRSHAAWIEDYPASGTTDHIDRTLRSEIGDWP
jgi:ferredoxin